MSDIEVEVDSVQLDTVQLDTFIDHLWLEDGLSKNTLDSYRADLSQFNAWLTKQHKELLSANQADIQQYLAVKFPQCKPRSISRLIASLRRFYRHALSVQRGSSQAQITLATLPCIGSLHNVRVNRTPTLHVRSARTMALISARPREAASLVTDAVAPACKPVARNIASGVFR